LAALRKAIDRFANFFGHQSRKPPPKTADAKRLGQVQNRIR
jgi:hypothetical protein